MFQRSRGYKLKSFFSSKHSRNLESKSARCLSWLFDRSLHGSTQAPSIANTPLRLSTRSPGLSAYRLHTTFRLLPLLQSCFTSSETVVAIRDGSPVPLLLHTAAELCVFRQLGRCCFASTETVGTIRDGEPRTATSAFTQLLSSSASVG